MLSTSSLCPCSSLYTGRETRWQPCFSRLGPPRANIMTIFTCYKTTYVYYYIQVVAEGSLATIHQALIKRRVFTSIISWEDIRNFTSEADGWSHLGPPRPGNMTNPFSPVATHDYYCIYVVAECVLVTDHPALLPRSVFTSVIWWGESRIFEEGNHRFLAADLPQTTKTRKHD